MCVCVCVSVCVCVCLCVCECVREGVTDTAIEIDGPIGGWRDEKTDNSETVRRTEMKR